MNALSHVLCVALTLALASAASAAPAPVTKAVRHPPSPGVLLEQFRAEGLPVAAIEHGEEAGTYVVTTVTQGVVEQSCLAIVVHRKVVVRTGPDVRADLRAFLQKQPRTTRITGWDSGRGMKR